MTPDDLRRLVEPYAAVIDEPAAWIAALEARCEADPTDEGLTAALLQTHACVTTAEGLPSVIAGVRRERLVRWDDHSATWDGVEVATGRNTRIRTLRGQAARDPVLRRLLLREGKLLASVLSVPVYVHDGAWPAITAVLIGEPLGVFADLDDHDRPEVLARRLGTAIDELARAEALGIGFPALDRRELLDTPAGIAVVCLTPTPRVSAGQQLECIARSLTEWWADGPNTPVDGLLAGMIQFAPDTIAEARERWQEALSEHLLGLRHALARRSQLWRHETRAERLRAAVVALEAFPPPQGVGAVSVDLEGQITVLHADGQRIHWTVGDQTSEIWGSAGLVVREARRLLRAHGSAPPNARLAPADPVFVDRACRWIGAALQLRTMRLLLDARR